jgi:hypothetical protein
MKQPARVQDFARGSIQGKGETRSSRVQAAEVFPEHSGTEHPILKTVADHEVEVPGFLFGPFGRCVSCVLFDCHCC